MRGLELTLFGGVWLGCRVGGSDSRDLITSSEGIASLMGLAKEVVLNGL